MIEIPGSGGPAGDTSVKFFPAITGKTGGTASDLDSLPTTGGGAVIGAGQLALVRTGAGASLNIWHLRAGTDAEDAPAGIVRPDDYAPTTNESVYELIL